MAGIFFKTNYPHLSRDVADIIAAYRQLPPYIAKKHLRAAMGRTVKPFIPALRANTPTDTGNLRRSVTSVTRFYNRADSGAVVGVVGFSRGGKTKRNMGNHGLFVEAGTKPRRTRTKRFCGSMPARGMLRRTLQTMQGPILANLRQEMAFALEKATRELASGKNPGSKS
jgi:hypothetical protein